MIIRQYKIINPLSTQCHGQTSGLMYLYIHQLHNHDQFTITITMPQSSNELRPSADVKVKYHMQESLIGNKSIHLSTYLLSAHSHRSFMISKELYHEHKLNV